EERQVQNIFPVERLDDMATAIGDTIGRTELAFGHANQTTVFRYPQLRSSARFGSCHVKRMRPEPVHLRVRASARKVRMKPQDRALLPAFDDLAVRAFVAAYYRRDAGIHREALGRQDG